MFKIFKKKQMPVFPIGSVVYYTLNERSIHPEKRERLKLVVTDQDKYGWVSTKKEGDGFPFRDIHYSKLEL